MTGTLTNPGIGSLNPDEPILRYVDLSTTHIASAARYVLPDWARTVIPGPRGAPLLYAGSRAGLPTAVLAFEPRRSDLPLQVAFPILLANLTGELLGGSSAPTEAVQPGTPVSLSIPGGATGLAVTRPDGSIVELVPGTALATTIAFSGTDLPGVYVVTPHVPPAASPSARGSGAPPAPDRPPRRLPVQAPRLGVIGSAAPSAAPIDPYAPVRFAVALFDVDESTIAPGSATAIEALGVAPTSSAAPGTGGTGGPEAVRPTTRDELWVPILLLVLLALCIEWAVYHRDALVRLQRGFALRGSAGTSRTGPPDGRRLRRAARAPAARPGAGADPRAPSRGPPSRGRRAAASWPSSSGPCCSPRSCSRWPGFQLVLPVDRLATVFVVDLSDSVGNAGREDALAFLRETLEERPDGDVAGIVAFGKDALVERLPSELTEIDRLASTPVKSATDIGAALRLASALFPDDAQKRIVLLSDGNDTTGDGQAEAALAASRGVRIETRRIGPGDVDEVLIERLTTPSTARLGESVPVVVEIRSSVAQTATVRLFANGALVQTVPVGSGRRPQHGQVR